MTDTETTVTVPLRLRCGDCYEFGHEACGCGECGYVRCGLACHQPATDRLCEDLR